MKSKKVNLLSIQRIYLNAQEEDNETFAWDFSQSIEDFYIASSRVSSYFNGSLDEFAIYSKVLSDNEIQLLYDSQKAIFENQIIHEGSNVINVTNCNLEEYQIYDFIGFLQNGDKVIKKFENQ